MTVHTFDGRQDNGTLRILYRRGARFAARLVKAAMTPAVGTLLLISSAHATYNTNTQGTVTNLMTYTSGALLFILNNQPASNGSCNAAYFELDMPGSNSGDPINDAAFNRMYARLLAAYSLGESVNVGYDDAGNCGGNGYIRVYRIG